MSNYLGPSCLTYLWNKIKAVFATKNDVDALQALYEGLTQSDIVVVEASDWPLANLQQNTIYRVQGTDEYYDYMYNGTTAILMATYSASGLSEIKEDVSRLVNIVEGGTTTEEIDGISFTHSNAYLYTQNGSIKSTTSGSYVRWNFANNSYTHIKVYVGLNSALPNGDGFPFLCFEVNSDFVPDPNDTYIYSKNGATYTKDGTDYTIANTGSRNFIYYEEDVARAKKNSITIDRDIPAGVIAIWISTRGSAVTDTITLTKEIPTEGLEDVVEQHETSLTQLESVIKVSQSGGLYIVGVGNFDGTNMDDSTVKSLQDVLSDLSN